MPTAKTTASNSTPISRQKTAAGFVAPYVGRVAQREVTGPFGMKLIGKGEVISQAIADRASHMGRLFELIAASEPGD